MECPVCGLLNPPHSSQCDCGYDFQKRTGGRRRRTHWLHSVTPSLWFAWLIITAGDFATLEGAGYSDRWNHFPNALFNLFTPVLFGNLSKASALILTVPLLFAGLFAGDWSGNRSSSLACVLSIIWFFSWALRPPSMGLPGVRQCPSTGWLRHTSVWS